MIPLFRDVSPLDHSCYQNYKMSEDLLMEHAALGLKEAVSQTASNILIVSGPGNNGADGIALARLLGNDRCTLYLPFGAKSSMAKLQLERVEALGITPVATLPENRDFDIIIDALFGTGLSRDLDDASVTLIERLNHMSGYKIACDIPSGLDLDGRIRGAIFDADLTVTMGGYKEALFSDTAKDFVGEIRRANLGVSDQHYETESNTFLVESSDLALPFRTRANTHKGDFGHLCVVGGKMPGAAIIAAKASLAFGVGKVTILENEPYEIPFELMSSSHLPSAIDAICIGMGLGNQYDDEYLTQFLLHHDKPMLIDADLFYQSITLKVLNQHKSLVLTPHPREFVQLLKLCDLADITTVELQDNRLHYARLFTKHFPDAVLLLKGANPIITYADQTYIIHQGTPALSKGGSGDVLSGMISALLAQGHTPIGAAIQGALAHAMAGKKFDKNNYSLTPLDLIETIKTL